MCGSSLVFTSFSGHGPADSECARTGLRSHARCHPYPIPQPVKVGHTTGVYDPYSFRIVVWVLLRPTRTNQWKCCETGPTVFRPCPRRLESVTICRCHYKGSTFFSPNWANQALERPRIVLRSQILSLPLKFAVSGITPAHARATLPALPTPDIINTGFALPLPQCFTVLKGVFPCPMSPLLQIRTSDSFRLMRSQRF